MNIVYFFPIVGLLIIGFLMLLDHFKTKVQLWKS